MNPGPIFEFELGMVLLTAGLAVLFASGWPLIVAGTLLCLANMAI